MGFNRLTWIGLAVAAAGWALLLFGWAISQDVWKLVDRLGSAGPDLSGVSATNSLIVSGLGLAILGVLQSGFGALDRFFEAVLLRSQHARVPAAPAVQPPSGLTDGGIAEEGWMGNRAFVRFANGTVQVETLLGVRNFASFEEAREFIGS